MTTTTIEQELDDHMFLALSRYARYIVRFHFTGFMAEFSPAGMERPHTGKAIPRKE